MQTANAVHAKTNEVKLVSAQDIDANPELANQFVAFFCPECGCRVSLSSSSKGNRYFRHLEHVDGCSLALPVRIRHQFVAAGEELDTEKLIFGADRPVAAPDEKGSNPGALKKPEIDNTDEGSITETVIDLFIKRIGSMMLIRRELATRGPDDELGGFPVRSIVLTAQRRADLLLGAEPGMIAISLRRVLPSALAPNFAVPRGFVLLSETTSGDKSKPKIFCLVRMKNDWNNKRFREQVMGSSLYNVEKDPRPIINVFGLWHRDDTIDIPNGRVLLSAEVNYPAVEFSNLEIRLLTDGNT